MSAINRAGAEGRRLGLMGLGLVGVLCGLVALSVALYDHAFSAETGVVVTARRLPPELNIGGDVRMNGAIVGRISAIDSTPAGAHVRLLLDDGAAREVPTDALAQFLPTTLFGQKYVDLHSTSDPAVAHVHEGSVLAEDTSTQAAELTDVLDDLEPLLHEVHTDSLAAALGGLAGGLDGKGQELHSLIASSAHYLAALNGHHDELAGDLQLLASVSGSYDQITPTLLTLFKETSSGLNALGGNLSTLNAFTQSVSGAADAGKALLQASQASLAQSTALSRPTLQLLARYSPELDCVIQGFLQNALLATNEIRDNRFQGYFTIGQQANGFSAKDAPVNGDLGTGPNCRGLSNAPVPFPGFHINDGVTR